MMDKILGSGVGLGVSYATAKLGNYISDFVLDHYEKIPTEVAKVAVLTGATGLGVIIGRDYYHSRKLSKIYGHD